MEPVAEASLRGSGLPEGRPTTGGYLHVPPARYRSPSVGGARAVKSGGRSAHRAGYRSASAARDRRLGAVAAGHYGRGVLGSGSARAIDMAARKCPRVALPAAHRSDNPSDTVAAAADPLTRLMTPSRGAARTRPDGPPAQPTRAPWIRHRHIQTDATGSDT